MVTVGAAEHAGVGRIAPGRVCRPTGIAPSCPEAVGPDRVPVTRSATRPRLSVPLQIDLSIVHVASENNSIAAAVRDLDRSNAAVGVDASSRRCPP